MKTLAQKSITGFLQLIVGLGVMIFVPAWTFEFWQAWVYLGVFGLSVVLIFAYLYKNDQKLLESRLNRTEKEETQKQVQLYMYMAYISVFIIPALDHRFGWSDVSFSTVMAGDGLVVLGYFIIFMVLRENSFAAATIEVNDHQHVISTGPYAIIRHPMYLGGMIMLTGTPLALGSWWGLLTMIPITCIISWRALDEEKFLAQRLPGYNVYCQNVRHRLVPFIW